jgi:hypothetical protein
MANHPFTSLADTRARRRRPQPRRSLRPAGFRLPPLSPAGLPDFADARIATRVKSEIAKWAKVIREADIGTQ